MTVAATDRIQIKGADYHSFSTGDGYYTIKDVVLCGEIKKGTKDAPKDYKAPELQTIVDYSQKLYHQGSFCSSAHKGHNKQFELTDPELLGFVLPQKVGRVIIDAIEQDGIIGDVKLKAAAFEAALKGELPFISPEIAWPENHLRSIAFLGAKCPHFKAPLFTVLAPINDPSAKFEAVLGRFDYFDPTEGIEEKKKESKKETIEEDISEGKCCSHCMAYQKASGGKFMSTEGNPQAGKPNGAPKEQENGKPATPQAAGTKMEAEARDAARFAAMEDANAALKKRLDERDAQDKAKALEAKALESMKGYQIGDRAKAQIAKFAQQGEEALNAFIATLQEITPKDSPRTFAAAEAAMGVPINDPALAKFAQAGPEKLESAARFASEYRTLKAHGAGKGMTITEEAYVRFQMEAEENPDKDSWGINLGVAK